jgi:hypothetical protein
MPTVKDEIIADITGHIRQFGGNFGVWCVGTASDWHCPVLEAHQIEDKDDALICREAYTAASARAVRDYFVTQCDVALGNSRASEEGKLVYVYRELPLQPRDHSIARPFVSLANSRTSIPIT